MDPILDLIVDMRQELLDTRDFCDHSVGICACLVTRMLEEADLLLGYRVFCEACNGTGNAHGKVCLGNDSHAFHGMCGRCGGHGSIENEELRE